MPVGAEIKKELDDINDGVKAVKQKSDELAAQLKKQEAELKAHSEVAAETREATAKLEKQYIDVVQNELGKIQGFDEKYQEDLKKLRKHIDDLEAKYKKQGFGGPSQVKTLPQLAQENEKFMSWSPDTGGNSPQLKVGSFWRNQKTVSTTAALRAVLGTTDLEQIFALPRVRRMHMRDYMTVIPTQDGSIDYVVETGYTNNAGPVAETASESESALSFDNSSETMCLISHGVTVTRQQATHIAPMMAYVERRLYHGIANNEDTQIISGDGTGANYTGIRNRANVQTYSRHVTGDTRIDAIRRSFTQLHLIELDADLVVVSPVDKEYMDLTKGTDEHYIWTQVATPLGSMLWQKPLFPSTAMPEGQFLTGNFELGAMIFDRESAFVQVFDQHKDYAEKNQYYVKGLQQSVLIVPLPEAFVSGAYEAAAGSGSGS